MNRILIFRMLYFVVLCSLDVQGSSSISNYTEETKEITDVKDLSLTLGNAKVTYKNNTLYAATGKVERTWKWSGSGFQTISLVNTATGKEWCAEKSPYDSDWNLPAKIENGTKGTLVSVDGEITDDEKFTSEHLSVTAFVRYPNGLVIKFLLRAYHDAPGIWTALEVKADTVFSAEGIPEDLATYKSYGSNQPVKIAHNEFIPVDFSKENQRRLGHIQFFKMNKTHGQMA